jgi:hypothetical protein
MILEQRKNLLLIRNQIPRTKPTKIEASITSYLVEALRVLSLCAPVYPTNVNELISLIIKQMSDCMKPSGFALTEVGTETKMVSVQWNREEIEDNHVKQIEDNHVKQRREPEKTGNSLKGLPCLTKRWEGGLPFYPIVSIPMVETLHMPNSQTHKHLLTHVRSQHQMM